MLTSITTQRACSGLLITIALLLLSASPGMANDGRAMLASDQGPKPASDPLARPPVMHVQPHMSDKPPLPPLPATREHLRMDYDRPPPGLSARVLAGCSAGDFAGLDGSALANAVKTASWECINSLFSVDGSTGAGIFSESQMVSIADAMATDAINYPGNNSSSMLQLVLYLRAGYYVQFYNGGQIGNYGPGLDAAIDQALNAFTNNGHFTDVNDAHGEILSEVVTLIDSAERSATQIDTISGILDRYGPSHHGLWYMEAAVNNVFTVLFRGQQLDDFRSAVQQHPNTGILDTLVDFINQNKNADLGSNREYMLQNAAGELARFLITGAWGYPESFHNQVHPKVKSVLDQFSMTGYGASVYVRMAGVIIYEDNEHCAYFGLCNFIDDLEDHILPEEHARNCSPTLRVRSQALTSGQLDEVCDEVSAEEVYFHDRMQTNHVPVDDDYNETLEMVIFHSSTDYENYSGTLFGNDTNNGGMYLEGNPSNPNNQARFLAYEAEWMRPEFHVWNLTHEYIHYLDGRFNWWGMFSDYPMNSPASAIWFIEGFAEYMSWSFRQVTNDNAVSSASNPGKFTLGQVFDNDYNSSQERIYQWGYLATRFMFERHEAEVDSMFTITRAGNYQPGYRNWLDPVRNIYNNEFREWLICFHSGNGDTSACGGPPVDPPPSGGDSIFADRFDTSGNDDDDGGSEPPPEPGVGECTLEDERELENGCKRGGLSASTVQEDVWLYIYVPEGTGTLRLEMSGGEGDADLYQKHGGWPGTSDYDNAGTAPGNDETLIVSNPGTGWHYLLLKAKSDSFDGVQVAAFFD